MPPTIARQFAEYCASLSLSDMDAADVDYTKKLLFDTLGTTVGGYEWSDSAAVMVETGRALGGGDGDAGVATDDTGRAGGDGTATVLATGERLDAGAAALANGALSHSLDYDNRHSPGSLHIGSSVVSAALAAADSADADGRTLLEGIVAGYDVAARLGMACNPRSSHERGFHPTGTCGTFAATAAAGVVVGLSVDQFVAAFGVNGSQAGASYQCSRTGGWNKRIHPGLAARRAFAALAFAENGFRGPPDPIEGELGFLQAYADRPRPERATTDLGEVYEAARTKVKPYPVGTFAHVPIALLTDLVAEGEVDPSTVEEVVVELPTSGAAMFAREADASHPTTSADAQFDMPFSVALALTAGEVGLTAFDAAIADEYPGEFGRLMDATRTIGSEELEAYLPELYPGRVTVRTASGTVERFRDWVAGEPDHPMSWADLSEKFADLTPRFDEAGRAAVADAVRTVEDRSARELIAVISSAGESRSDTK
ncbi:MmgE/PrpD family protein [Halorubrum sp. DTA46]|uniref:MmgE/PrpD family protein n=1 Tax=Halorubrum sp. DTA46 TaxID=3402162 RepID=UPI003AACC44C